MIHNKTICNSVTSILIFILTVAITICSLSPAKITYAGVSDYFSFVVLSDYSAALDIGDEYMLYAVTSTLKKPTWKSSDSKIASVSSQGLVTAKKAGTVKITAKIKNAEASCIITVYKTRITLSHKKISMQNNETAFLSVETSNGSAVTYKSSKSSIAEVTEFGLIKAKKPGTTTITVQADGTKVTCKVTVKKPTVRLSRTSASLYRNNTLQLTAEVSSTVTPVWKSSRSSIAVVDDNGLVTAVKHGTASISVIVDGVVKVCKITVQKPDILLSDSEITMKPGQVYTLTADVSSGNTPAWSTSNSNIVTISSDGIITAHNSGKVYVYCSEDGMKVRCTVFVEKHK